MSPNNDPEFIIDPELQFVSQTSADFLAYWEAKRGARPFPARKDIVPREIEKLLPWLHMFDVIDYTAPEGGDSGMTRDFRIRLLGTAIADAAGIPGAPGQLISAAKNNLIALRTWQGLQSVFDTRKPVRTFSSTTAFPGKNFMGSEVCMAPLSSNGTDVDIIIGVTSLLEKPK